MATLRHVDRALELLKRTYSARQQDRPRTGRELREACYQFAAEFYSLGDDAYREMMRRARLVEALTSNDSAHAVLKQRAMELYQHFWPLDPSVSATSTEQTRSAVPLVFESLAASEHPTHWDIRRAFEHMGPYGWATSLRMEQSAFEWLRKRLEAGSFSSVAKPDDPARQELINALNELEGCL